MLSDYFVGAVIALCITILGVMMKLRWRSSEALPPGPWGLPLLGYLPFLGRELHREFAKLASIHGPIFKLYLGTKMAVVITSPAVLREVVRDQDLVFANHDMTVSGSIGSLGGNDILFAPYGPEWKKLRKIFVREMLSRSNLDSLLGFRREAIRDSVSRLYQGCGGETNVGKAAFEMVVKAMMSMLCGGVGASNLDHAGLRDLATEFMVLLGKINVSDLFPALAWLDLQGVERDTRKVVNVFEAMLDSVIQLHRSRTSEQANSEDFLQFLLKIHDSEESITMTQLKALLMDIVVGGSDTTTTTVEWAMSELFSNGDALSKVMEELNQVVGLDSLVEERHVPELTYLNAAIKEVLRLHPPLSLLVPRYPTKSTTVAGYSVPKHTKVFVNVWAIHRDPSLWESPMEFRPERFLTNGGTFDFSGNDLSYIPFGSGRRVCAGIPLVDRMLNYVVASLLHSFHWRLPPNTTLDLSDLFGIVVKKRQPLILIPSPRLSHLHLYTSA